MDDEHPGMEAPGEEETKGGAREQSSGGARDKMMRSDGRGEKRLTAWTKARIAAQASIMTIAVLFVASIIWKNWAPFGASVRYEIEIGKESEFVTLPSPLTHSAVVGDDGNGLLYQVDELVMATEQVRFKLKMPYESLRRLKFEIDYGGDPEELLIALVNPADGQLTSKPVHNRSLNGLGWSALSEDNTMLFQKNPIYPDTAAFLDAFQAGIDDTFSEPGKKVASYYYPLKPVYPGVDPASADKEVYIDHSFRGKHILETYVTGGALAIGFDWQDINWTDGPDPLSVFVFSDAGMIHAESFLDDGDQSASNISSAPRRCELFLPDTPEGVYKIEISCGNDIVFSGISSAQNYLCFYENIFLADHPMYGASAKPGVLFTNGKRLNAQTWHTEGIQSINVNGNRELVIDEVSTSFSIEMEDDVNEIITQTGSVILSSKGAYFSFSPESLFVPIAASPYSRLLPLSDFNYIITDYVIPEQTGEGWKQEVVFNLDGVTFVDRMIEVILIAPGLSTGAPITLARIEALGEK